MHGIILFQLTNEKEKKNADTIIGLSIFYFLIRIINLEFHFYIPILFTGCSSSIRRFDYFSFESHFESTRSLKGSNSWGEYI